MKELEIKSQDNKLLAKVFPSRMFVNELRFLTPPEYPLQIGLIQPKETREVKAHKHVNTPDDMKFNCQMQEFIYVIEGEVEAIIYDDNFKDICTIDLKKGDSILQIAGGHSFKIKKGARLLEVKQGKYLDDDKIFKE